MRKKRSGLAIALALSLAAVLSGCSNAEQARASAERDVPQVRKAIEPATRTGLQYTVTAESSCSEGCSGIVVIELTAGELQVADVLALHEALRDVDTSGTLLSRNGVVLQVPDQYRLVPFEAGFCTSGGGSFPLQDDPDPGCIPRTSTPTPSPHQILGADDDIVGIAVR
ncbi:hypothetical protein ABCS02_28620 [Microbacterium sp. X-17]|uniref:hypothetical protein n=1 Tax=Microbacterium sp. X-17 TaxID=3144404 RepID=UPI0031F535DB